MVFLPIIANNLGKLAAAAATTLGLVGYVNRERIGRWLSDEEPDAKERKQEHPQDATGVLETAKSLKKPRTSSTRSTPSCWPSGFLPEEDPEEHLSPESTPALHAPRSPCAARGVSIFKPWCRARPDHQIPSDLRCRLHLGAQVPEATAPTPPPGAGEHPELSRIIHILNGWPPERLALLRKLLETADTHLSDES